MAEGEEIYGEIEFPDRDTPGRPYVMINMVASVDGRVSFAGKASGIGSEADRQAMRTLRSRADAVMVGAGTLRAEKLNLGLDDTSVRQPLGVVVCGAGPAPVSDRLVRRGGQELLLAVPGVPSSRPGEEPQTGEDGIEVLRVPGRDPGHVDPARLLEILRMDRKIGRLLVEGGPGLNASLLRADLVDELFVTAAPRLLGGEEKTIVAGGTDDRTRDLELISVHSAGDELFFRYRVRTPSTPK